MSRCRFIAFDCNQSPTVCTLTTGHESEHHLVTALLCTEHGCRRIRAWRGLCGLHGSQARRAGTCPPIQPKIVAEPRAPRIREARPRVPLHQQPTTAGPQPLMRRPVPEAWQLPISAWAAHMTLQDMSPHSIELRLTHLARLARDIDKPPFDVTLDDLVMWVSGMAWKNETSRAVRSSLRTFYSWAVKTKRITHSPAAEFPTIRPGLRNPKPVPENDIDFALVVAVPRVQLMIRLAAELGLRRAEVAAVHLDDLTDTADGPVLRILGKGRKERHVPVPPALADLIRHAFDPLTGWLFPAPGGRHLQPHTVGSLVSRQLPADYSMHKLRHRAATQIHRATGGDLLLTAEFLGHASTVTTQVYVAPDYSRLRTAVQGIAR